MLRNGRTIVSKLLGGFAASAIFALYLIASFEVDGELFLYFPALFIVFAVVLFVAFPISLLTDKVAASSANGILAFLIYVLLGAAAYGAAVFALRINAGLAGYGLALHYLFCALDYVFSRLERKKLLGL
ncbi:hypothetical protein [Cohnella boryungensis]|uniref:Uncharacterized protein n=1 Tax=Cohnella boryungensis TaxID=768479 RepID=A0ABV8SJ31_9BACL